MNKQSCFQAQLFVYFNFSEVEGGGGRTLAQRAQNQIYISIIVEFNICLRIIFVVIVFRFNYHRS
jgi:hypothetical protein